MIGFNNLTNATFYLSTAINCKDRTAKHMQDSVIDLMYAVIQVSNP